MPSLQHKHILLGVTGGIAAYKSAELIRLLRASGAEVRIVMTKDATEFITPLTLQTLSGHKVYLHAYRDDLDSGMSHIELARWADLVLIAPATANCLAKLAHGLSDDLLSTLVLATEAPVSVAPAMNQQMWLNPATQANLAALRQRNLYILGPDSGEQACGEIGPGRLLSPEKIIDELTAHFSLPFLKHKRILITAGPTQEPLDPVRYLTNHASGKMGYALAHAAARCGAEVILISGPTALPTPGRVQKISVMTAQEMLSAVIQHLPCDIFIGTAAVSDYRPRDYHPQKIKKLSDTLTLTLDKNPDILAQVSQLNPRPFIIGFAAETCEVIEHAKLKLIHKKLDMVVANQVGPHQGFKQDDNELTVITPEKTLHLPRAPKSVLAYSLLKIIPSLP